MLSIVAASSERPDHPSHSLPAAHTLICFSHLRWNFDSHRLQQLMSRFARGGRVIYWEEPEEATPDCEPALGVRTCAETGVVVVTPSLPEPMKTADRDGALRRLLNDFLAEEDGPFIRWYCDPAMLVFSRHLVSAATIYDRAVASPGSLPALERELGDVADFTFTGDADGLGARLARAVRPLAPANLNRPPTLLAAEPQLG